jgi:hypothetical protein
MPDFFCLTQFLHVERPSFQLLGRPCVFNLLYIGYHGLGFG